MAAALVAFLWMICSICFSVKNWFSQERPGNASYELTAQLLCPEVASGYFWVPGWDTIRSASVDRFAVGEKWQVKRLSYFSDQLRSQGYYAESQTISSIQMTEDLGDKKLYTISFSCPVPVQELFVQLEPLIEEPELLDHDSGVLWIPIKSSSDMEELAIGMRGNLRYGHTIPLAAARDGLKNYCERKFAAEEQYFKDSLRYLQEHPGDFYHVLDSVFQLSPEELDLQKRYDYLQQNMLEAVGVMLVSVPPGFRCFD